MTLCEILVGSIIFVIVAYLVYKCYKVYGGGIAVLIYINGVFIYYIGYTGGWVFTLNKEHLINGMWAMVSSASMFGLNNQVSQIHIGL